VEKNMDKPKSKSTFPIKLSPAQWLAWLGTLLLSILPDVLFRELTGNIPAWLYGIKLSLIALLLLLSLFWKPAKDLQRYFLVFLAIFLAERAWQAVAESPQWQSWFPSFGTGFLLQLFSIQLGRIAVAFAIIASLFIVGFKRQETFVGFGDLAAPAAPIPAVGVDQPTDWRSLGLRLSLYAFLAMVIILAIFFGGNLNANVLSALLPALPMIILLAAMNSFSEEVTYRAALLTPIHKVLGASQAIWLTAVFFGIGHFYGVPSGIAGVLATGFFGWILARSMVETKGLFWPWFIHLWADVVIFSFMAIGALQLGS
jgi:membrane protease YdiL (CAAX protease family)